MRGHGGNPSPSPSPSRWPRTHEPAVVALLHDVHPVALQQLQFVGVLGPVLVQCPVPARHSVARARTTTGPAWGRRATVSLLALLTGSTGFRSRCRTGQGRGGCWWVPPGLCTARGGGGEDGCNITGQHPHPRRSTGTVPGLGAAAGGLLTSSGGQVGHRGSWGWAAAGCGGPAGAGEGFGAPARGSFGEGGKAKPRWRGEDGHPPASSAPRSAARGELAESGGPRGPGERCRDGEPAGSRGLAEAGEGGKSSAVVFTRGSFTTCT